MKIFRRKEYIIYPILVLVFFSCKKALKDINDYYPVVKTVSAEFQSDGTVLVTGKLVSEGAGVVDKMGFCFDTVPEPSLLQNQLIINGIFSGAFDYPFIPFTKYYFRSWAKNEYGYAYGESIMLELYPPCDPTLNSVNRNVNVPGSVEEMYTTMGDLSGFYNLEFYASTGSTIVYFEFGDIPETGLYATTINSPDQNEVQIRFYYPGSNANYLESGSDVFVKRINSTQIQVTVCEAKWTENSNSFYFTTHLVYPM